MWPSESGASRIYDCANVGLIFGLAIGVVSTALVVWMGKVKESYSEAENRRLNVLIQPRFLTLQQQRHIGAALLPFKGQKVMVWVASLNDPESYHFAEQIFAACRAARLDCQFLASSPNGRQYSAITETGIKINWTSIPRRSLADAIKNALCTVGRVRKVSLVEGVPPVSGLTSFLENATFIGVFPKPFDVLP